MADLKTNYVDDVLDTTKNQLRKYQQIQNDDGTVSFVDVTEYTQVGTSFGAKDINDTNAAINDVNGKLNMFGNLNVKSTNNGTLPNIIQKNGFYLIVAKRWTVADAGMVCLCDWVDGSQPYIYTVQRSNTFSIATNSDGTITAMYNGYTSGVYLTVMRLY